MLTPLLVVLLLFTNGGSEVSLESVRDIMLQLLVPFVAGQSLRRWIGGLPTTIRRRGDDDNRSQIAFVMHGMLAPGSRRSPRGSLCQP